MGIIVAKPRGASIGIVKEPAIGNVDGSNIEFETTFGYFPDSLTVYYRGLREGNAIPLGGKRFRMPAVPRAGSSIIVEYVKF